MVPEHVVVALNVILPTIAVAVVWHECAHILVGRLFGFRTRELRLLYWRFRGWRQVERVPSPITSLGAVELTTERPLQLRTRHSTMIVAGPVADLILCGSLLSAAKATSTTDLGFPLFVAAVAVGLMALSDIAPVRRKNVYSDGRWLLEWVLNPDATSSRVAVSVLHWLCMDGWQPKEMPEDWLQLALTVPDSSPRSRVAQAYAFDAAVGHRQFATAQVHLLQMLKASDPQGDPKAHAQLLAGAAFFAARYQNQPIRARELLVQAIEFSDLSVYISSGVEAAILLAEGDAEGAVACAKNSFASRVSRPEIPAGWVASETAELQELLDEARGSLAIVAVLR